MFIYQTSHLQYNNCMNVVRKKMNRFWRGSNSRPSADVITTTPQNPWDLCVHHVHVNNQVETDCVFIDVRFSTIFHVKSSQNVILFNNHLNFHVKSSQNVILFNNHLNLLSVLWDNTCIIVILANMSSSTLNLRCCPFLYFLCIS